MMIYFLMSCSLLLHSINDPPDIYTAFELLPPKAEALVTYRVRQSWERCLHLRCLIGPTEATMSCLYHLSLGTLSHHSILLFLFIFSSNRSITTSPFFSSTLLLFFLPPSLGAPVMIQSAFNTCQPSWGTSYTVRISFVRAPQDVIRGIITRPYG